MAGFDIIGDIHGHADALQRLLRVLGYASRGGVYRHPVRKAVFAGDFVDRGPRQREVLRVARAMVEAGSARAVMGNHEFNAMGWATPNGTGGFLRHRSSKNYSQHQAFLEQTGEGSAAHGEAVAWFKTLPLWLDLGGLRVVHACWHPASQEVLAGCLGVLMGYAENGRVVQAYAAWAPMLCEAEDAAVLAAFAAASA